MGCMTTTEGGVQSGNTGTKVCKHEVPYEAL